MHCFLMPVCVNLVQFSGGPPPPSQCEPLCMEYIYVSKKPFAGLKTAVRDTRQFNTHTPRSEILDIPLQIISPFRNK